MLAGKIDEDIRLTAFSRLEITLTTSVALLLELLPVAESTELDFDDFRGSFARICFNIVDMIPNMELAKNQDLGLK